MDTVSPNIQRALIDELFIPDEKRLEKERITELELETWSVGNLHFSCWNWKRFTNGRDAILLIG